MSDKPDNESAPVPPPTDPIPTDDDPSDPNQAAYRHIQRLIERAEGPDHQADDSAASSDNE